MGRVTASTALLTWVFFSLSFSGLSNSPCRCGPSGSWNMLLDSTFLPFKVFPGHTTQPEKAPGILEASVTSYGMTPT